MMTKEEIVKLSIVKTKLSKKCKCGHSIFMPVYQKKTICSYCGKLVFRDSKEEFKHKMERMMNK